jgi:nitrate reductase beta subunit
MLFYIPPITPVVGERQDAKKPFVDTDEYRLPIQYLAALFAAGDEQAVRYSLRKQQAVRMHRRAVTVGDVEPSEVAAVLAAAECPTEQAEAIYHLSAISAAEERFAMPAMSRETMIEREMETSEFKARSGFGARPSPERGA